MTRLISVLALLNMTKKLEESKEHLRRLSEKLELTHFSHLGLVETTYFRLKIVMRACRELKGTYH